MHILSVRSYKLTSLPRYSSQHFEIKVIIYKMTDTESKRKDV